PQRDERQQQREIASGRLHGAAEPTVHRCEGGGEVRDGRAIQQDDRPVPRTDDRLSKSSASPMAIPVNDMLKIKDVAERTGVAAATIRMWEQRYGFPTPSRTPAGYRLYTEADIEA